MCITNESLFERHTLALSGVLNVETSRVKLQEMARLRELRLESAIHSTRRSCDAVDSRTRVPALQYTRR